MPSVSRHRPFRVLTAALAILLILSACATASACSRAPRAEDLRETVRELVEASYELNAVFYGAGLPVLDRDSELYEGLYAYLAPSSIVKDYDIVSPHAKFSRIEDIKTAAKQVFSPSWCEDVLFVSAFSGVSSDLGGTMLVSEPRFMEDDTYLYQFAGATDYLTRGEKIYDYSTLRVVRPSNATSVGVEMTAWYVSNPDDRFTASLRLLLTDDGWRLDSPTY